MDWGASLKHAVDVAKNVVPQATAAAYKRGRLAILSTILGRVAESSDPAFAARKDVLLRMEHLEVDMLQHLQRLVRLLHAVAAEVEAITAGMLDFDAIVAAGSAVVTKSTTEERNSGQHDNQDVSEALRVKGHKIRMLAEATAQTLQNSCWKLTDSSLAALRKDAVGAYQAVRNAQVELDLARAEAVSAIDHVVVVEATYDEAVAACSTVGGGGRAVDQFRVARDTARRNASAKEAKVEHLVEAYQESLRRGSVQLDFIFEQVTMSTWSAYNIFWTEMGNFFRDSSQAADGIAHSLITMKNSQLVALKLTQERRERLARERESAQGTASREGSGQGDQQLPRRDPTLSLFDPSPPADDDPFSATVVTVSPPPPRPTTLDVEDFFR